jgi:transcription antitermination factor NusG
MNMHGVIPLRDEETIPASFPIGLRWYAIYTNIKCEERVQKGLVAKGYRTFLPKERRWVTHSRVKSVKERPLLSRYVFVENDPNHGFSEIRNTDGVESILSNCDIPQSMPDGLITDFLCRQLKGEFDRTKDQPLGVGCRIRIMDGPYEDFFATIVEMGGRSGGEILAQLMGSRIRRRLTTFSVRPA